MKKINITNFKGYSTQQTIDFAIPNGSDGSGLTFIVGENNTGKSSIFDAIKKLHHSSKFLPKERNSGNDPEIEFVDKNGGLTRVTRGKKATASIATNGLVNPNIFELIPSRRHWQHNFHAQNVSSYSQYFTNSLGRDTKYSVDSDLGGLLEKIADNALLKNEFNLMMKMLIPSFADWEIDTDDSSQDFVKYFTTTGVWHDTSLVGDGVISLFRICAHLVSTNDSLILFIDEPELSLSPITQKSLALVLSKKAKEKQIIITTHCPHLVRWQDIVTGAQVYRTKKDINGKCEIKKLDSGSANFKTIVAGLDDWQKPHMLDAVAKEIFFSDNVLYLEGQEDVGLIKKFMHENGFTPNFEIFGYGTGGSGNIPAFFELSKNLGIKAAAIFDRNAPGLTKARSFSEFHISEHDYDDIRYKVSRPERTGMFNENGTIDATKGNELMGLLTSLTSYFGKP